MRKRFYTFFLFIVLAGKGTFAQQSVYTTPGNGPTIVISPGRSGTGSGAYNEADAKRQDIDNQRRAEKLRKQANALTKAEDAKFKNAHNGRETTRYSQALQSRVKNLRPTSKLKLQPFHNGECVEPHGLFPAFEAEESKRFDDPNDMLGTVSRIGISLLPLVGDFIDFYEGVAGVDVFTVGTGDPKTLDGSQRLTSIAGLIVGSGHLYREGPVIIEQLLEERFRFQKWSKRFSNSKVRNADELNTISRAAGREPEWLPRSEVLEGILNRNEKFVRIHNEKNEAGFWLIKEESVRGLTPLQIKEKLALPTFPTHISHLKVPKGTKIRRGLANSVFDGTAGAMQYEIVGAELKEVKKWVTKKSVPLSRIMK